MAITNHNFPCPSSKLPCFPSSSCARSFSTDSYVASTKPPELIPTTLTTPELNPTPLNAMTSLVSDFIITPVLRQARRFSSGFATEEPGAPQHHRASSFSILTPRFENAIMEEAGQRSGGAVADTTATTQAPEPPAQPLSRLPNLSVEQSAISVDAVSPPNLQLPPSAATQEAAAPQEAITPVRNVAKTAPLPEDDGMGDLRKRIREVQEMDVPNQTKAKMMHQILMENYKRAQNAAEKHAEKPAPGKTQTLSRAPLPVPEPAPAEPIGPLQALKSVFPLLGQEPPPILDLAVTDKDREKTYAPVRRYSDDGHADVEEGDDAGQYRDLGCKHYRRNIKLQCVICEKWYTCRLCHDEAEDHILPRKQTKHMLCMLCGFAQKASDTCVKCRESAAYYYCQVCKLWNNDPNKSIYHCPDCGLCRIGQGLGKDFLHCKKCMACISTASEHKCIERSIDCNCPICGDYMFDSIKSVVFMQCGHSIHRVCLEEHRKTSYKCPICSKSCENMASQFRNIDLTIASQPMPPEYATARAIVSCNDCGARSKTKYHWVGLKCGVCSSYNTIQLRLENMPGGDGSEQSEAVVDNHPMLDEAAIALLLAEQAEAGRRLREEERDREAAGQQQPALDLVTAALERMAIRAAAQSGNLFSLSNLLPRLLRSPEAPRREAPATGRTGSSSPPAVRLPRTVDESDSDMDNALDLFQSSDPEQHFGLRGSNPDEEGEDDEEEESSSEEEEDGEYDEDDDEDDDNDINLLGHR